MTTKQEILLESRHQVVNKLKEQKENIILTCPILGIPEVCLTEYKKECKDKIITVTKMQEITTQLKKNYQAQIKTHGNQSPKESIFHELDFSFYIDLLLATDLCKQLRRRKLDLCSNLTNEEKTKTLRGLKNFELSMLKKQHNFILEINQDYLKDYKKNMYLESLVKELGEYYEWEWIILNFDNPITDAKTIQNVMLQYMQPTSQIGPKRTILSTYDESLQSISQKLNFQVLHMSDKISYLEMKYFALNILKYNYPKLESQTILISHVLNSPALQQFYEQANFPTNNFIEGITKFYDIYSCIYHDEENHQKGYVLSEIECLSTIYESINEAMKNNLDKQKKKSKLYI